MRLNETIIMIRLASRFFKFSSQASRDAALLAVTPLDGRYAAATSSLKDYFSEFALIKYRIRVEIEWLKFLCHHRMVQSTLMATPFDLAHLDSIYLKFELPQARRVKEIEQVTNHDVKAVEYFIKEELDKHPQFHVLKEYVHFCCTSEDINNIAYSLLLSDAKDAVLVKQLDVLMAKMQNLAHEHSDVAMLSRTHGQVASPTTVGKEIANFVYRIRNFTNLLRHVQFEAKLNGAVGNYNAHILAYPDYDWPTLSQRFIGDLRLKPNPYTTQIEPHDQIALFYSYLQLLNTVLLGFSRDMWQYISIGYLQQKAIKGEVGSSTMPHKINPIDFENCEGNLGLANSLAQHFITKLPISRFQRDLSDSTVMRNHGACFAYSLVAYRSLQKGLDKISPNYGAIMSDLDNHWEVLAEPIQQIMRQHGLQNPYEQLKEMTRGQQITKDILRSFILTLSIPEPVKQKLLHLHPKDYIGNADKMAKQI